MAVTFTDQSFPGTQLVYKWVVTSTTVSDPVRIGAYADKSYAMWGTFGNAVAIQGSWDNPDGTPAEASFITLNETDNLTPISFSAAACGAILENPVWIRVKPAAAVTSVTVVITAPWRRNM